MEIILSKKPKKPVILEGFPGLGFVGTVATEYLIDHLKAESIGKIWSQKLPPIAMIHGGDVRRLLEVFYAKKQNLVILHAIAGTKSLEWDLAQAVLDLAKQLKAKEIISIEGVGAPFGSAGGKSYFHTNNATVRRKLKRAGITELSDGAILGVSGALMLLAPKNQTTTFLFSESRSNLPDSKAASEIIKALDKYLSLKVPVEPLLKEAEKFEKKLKEIIQKSSEAMDLKKQKDIPTQSYFG